MRIVMGAVSLLVFLLILQLCAYYPEKKLLKAYEDISGMLKERERDSVWYQKTDKWLCRNGGTFHYGKWLNPTSYLLMRILLAIAGLLVLGQIALGYGVLAGLCLFFLPVWLLEYLNRQDNVRLLPEIKLLYHGLEIQIRAGVYVTDALAECYGSVTEGRLQKALLDLAGDIVMKADIYDAIERFQSKFDNRYIDALCITILQACESGQAVELLKDIGEQLKDMEMVVMNQRKSALDRSITLYQLAVLGAVLMVVIYACVSHMFAAAVRF